MKEPDNQPNNQPGAADGEAASSADLTSRLMQRHSQPIGLVDTNHAERFHERTAGWVARRFDLLDSWKTRYDTGDTPGTGDGKFIFAATPVQSGPAISSEALVTSAARQVARSAPAPATSSPAPREQYRVRRHVAPPASTTSTSTPDTSSPRTSTPLVTDSTQAVNTPEGQTENVGDAGSGSAGAPGSDLKLATGPAPDRGDPRGAEITTRSGENLQSMTRLNATNQISRSVDSGEAFSAAEVDGDKTPASRVDRSSLLVPSNTQQATAPMASPPIAELPVSEPGVSQTARSLTLVSARTEDVSKENPASEAVPTPVGEVASPPDKAESSAASPLRNPDSAPQQVQRQPLPGGGQVDQATGPLPLRIQRKPPPGGEESRQQIDSSPEPGQQQPSPVAERLVGQTGPPRVEGQPSSSGERMAPLTGPLPLRIQPKPSPASEELRPPVESALQQVQRQSSQSSQSLPGSEELRQPVESSSQPVQPQSSAGAERLGQQTEPLRLQAQPSSGSERLTQLTGSLPLRIQRQPSSGIEELPQHSDSPVSHNQQSPVTDQASNPAIAEGPAHLAAEQRLSTSEIRVASVNGPSPTTVLRKAAEAPHSGDGLLMKSTGNTNATLPLKVNRSAIPVEVIVARQAEGVSSAGASPTASATSEESPAAAKPGSIDLDQLAEQVGRVLSRQLAVERERRGNKGWH